MEQVKEAIGSRLLVTITPNNRDACESIIAKGGVVVTEENHFDLCSKLPELAKYIRAGDTIILRVRRNE